MSVYKPAKGRFWHYDFQMKGRRYTGSTGQTTRSKAEKVEAAKRLQAGTGELDRAEEPTLDEAAGEYWAARGAAKKSASDIERRIATCVRLVGPRKGVTEITTAVVARAIQRRRGELVGQKVKRVPSNATVNRDFAELRKVLNRSAKLNDGLRFPKIAWDELFLPEPKPQPIDFSPAEIERILAAVPDYAQDFGRFMLRYGCRISEMFFDPAVVDLEGGRIPLRERKGGDVHMIPIVAADLPELRARVQRAAGAGLDTIWYREVRGKPRPGRPIPTVRLVALRYDWMIKLFSRAMTASGVRASKKARGSHALRHHRGMTLLRRTGNLRLTQRALGHASIQSTLTYAHALEDDLRAALEAEIPADSRRAADEAEETPAVPVRKA